VPPEKSPSNSPEAPQRGTKRTSVLNWFANKRLSKKIVLTIQRSRLRECPAVGNFDGEQVGGDCDPAEKESKLRFELMAQAHGPKSSSDPTRQVFIAVMRLSLAARKALLRTESRVSGHADPRTKPRAGGGSDLI
jgi:hypothetical protein